MIEERNITMQFTINFTMDSDAFTEYPADEVRRILDSISNDIENILPPTDDLYYRKIKDINGNTIGELIISNGF